MSKSKGLHLVAVWRRPNWPYPTFHELIIDEGRKRHRVSALAICCDDCIKSGINHETKKIDIDIHYAIEIRDNQCFYHHIEQLKSVLNE